MTPPLCFASVLKLLRGLRLSGFLNIEATDSQVPYPRLNDRHATSMPDAARPELRFLSDLSRGIVETPVSTSVTIIDTSSMVHLHSSQSFTPNGSTPAFSHDAHYTRSLQLQLRVVWHLRLIGDTEGPVPHHWYSIAHSFLTGSLSWHTDNYLDRLSEIQVSDFFLKKRSVICLVNISLSNRGIFI